MSKKIQKGKVYDVDADDPQFFQKLSLYLSSTQNVGYSQENDFFLPTVMETLHMSFNVPSSPHPKLLNSLKICCCEELPLDHETHTFSGG